MSVDLSFSFTFLPEHDRIILWFQADGPDVPDPISLTRRMTRVLGGYLRQFLEKYSQLPENIRDTEKIEYMKFFHDQQIEAAPPTCNSTMPSSQNTPDFVDSRLLTKIDTQESTEQVILICYHFDTFLTNLTLDWKAIHGFLHALAQMSQQAEWALSEELTWENPWDSLSGQNGSIKIN